MGRICCNPRGANAQPYRCGWSIWIRCIFSVFCCEYIRHNSPKCAQNDESLGKLIEQMDADAFNLNRAETRRHIYMLQFEEKDCYIADDSDPLDDILKDELHEALMAAIEKLKPQQKELLRRIYENGETQAEIS